MIEAPHSPAAEQALLGMLMLDNGNYELVKGQLPADEFYVPLYREMYKAVGGLLENKQEATPITVASKVAGTLFGSEQDLIPEFTAIFDSASRGQSVTTYAYYISQKAYERKMICYAKALTEAVTANKMDDVKIIQTDIAVLAQTFVQIRPENPLQQLQDSFKAACMGGHMMKTGVGNWDDAFGGLFKGSRYIIAGHGGVGKSAFAVNLAWNLAGTGKKVRWITFEEDANALWWRIQARFGKVHIGNFRNGLSDEFQTKVIHAHDELLNHDFLVYQNLDKVGNIIQTCGLCDLIVIDGMTSWPIPDATKIEKAGIVTEYAKTIADRTGAAVIVLSHVNGDGIKNGSSITSIYGGQAATFDPEGIVELRFSDKEALEHAEEREIKMHVIKNRYGPPNIVKKFMYCGKYQSYRDIM